MFREFGKVKDVKLKGKYAFVVSTSEVLTNCRNSLIKGMPRMHAGKFMTPDISMGLDSRSRQPAAPESDAKIEADEGKAQLPGASTATRPATGKHLFGSTWGAWTRTLEGTLSETGFCDSVSFLLFHFGG